MALPDYGAGSEKYEKLQRLLADQKSISLEINRQLKEFEQLQSVLSGQSRISREIDRQVPEGAVPFQAMVKTAPEMIGDALIVLAKRAVSAGKVPAIVLTTSNYRAMLGALSEAGIDAGRVLIIDCVTKNISDESDRENVVFVDSLEDFPQLEISLIKLFESSRNFVLIFDSLDILRLYHRNEAISKIIHSITKVLRKSSATGYYLFGSGLLTKQLSQFFDYYVEIGKE